MKVIEIRTEDGLRQLKPAWEALLSESPSKTIFLTWEWVTAWWSAYGEIGSLRIWAAFDHNDVLRGVAPLRHRTVRRYARNTPVLSFLGDGSNDSEYLDLIVAAGYEQEVTEAFRSYCRDQMNRGQVLLLNEIPEISPNLLWLEELAQSEKALWTASEIPCGTVTLPESWDEYLGTLRPRFRTKIRSVLRNLEGRPEVRFGFAESGEKIRELLPVLYDLHAKRWAQEGKPGVFGWDKKRDFYAKVSPLLLDRGWLRFSWVEWNGRPLACQYGFTYGNTYFHLQEGYEPASEHWNVGMGLRAWSIREFQKQGIREYDFLGGIGRHKTDWGARVKHSRHTSMARDSYWNRVFCAGPEWVKRVREQAKIVLPEKLVAARRSYLEKQNGAALEPARQSPLNRVRGAVAWSYFHLGGPRLASPLRKKYQVELSSQGRWPSVSLSRRKEASARILCYHRVNDDGDPFFPALSTRRFEQEMRYIAGHYRVLSLPGLVDHLETNSTDTAVALTFDDGYQDNYLNALPILERYGLPAAVFLTTGCIDSREPIWFEQLAGALKRTTREFLDLEIDIPRRFWMRTLEERLEANSGIFSILRRLPDSDRRDWLDRVLRELGVSCEERRDRMLTWDQVREMKKKNIEFGGHTVTHPFLSRLTPERANWEVSECKRRIEAELQSPAEYFAYPNGREEDFDKWNEEVIRSAGYRAAVTTVWGLNYRTTDRMELKRGGPWEENAAQFAWKLDWYQLVNG